MPRGPRGLAGGGPWMRLRPLSAPCRAVGPKRGHLTIPFNKAPCRPAAPRCAAVSRRAARGVGPS
eukprot:8612406-Pyramimonas_sp.AAC.1